MRKRGSNKWYVYTLPAKKAIASIKQRVSNCQDLWIGVSCDVLLAS